MTHPNYERDKAEAQAVYDRMMLETHRIVVAARTPINPDKELPPFWSKVAKVLRLERALRRQRGRP